jgi:AcrR family transcriptional regulator
MRTRAGNAMARTRGALLDGAVRAVVKHGSRKTTMADVASLAGVAKATLYNHFRTKNDLYAAAVEAEVRSLGAECAGVAADEGLAAALARAAEGLGAHPAARRIATDEPAVLARLQTIGTGPGWVAGHEAVAATLRATGRRASVGEIALVLRWVVSYIGAPGSSDEIAVAGELLASALPVSAA